MIEPGERVLVAVSRRQGLARAVGHAARPRLRRRRAVHRARHRRVQRRVRTYARAFADERGLHARSRSTCRDDYGFDIPTGATAARRVPCSACGLSKRHLFDEAAHRRRLRRVGHRPQPRRRSRRAVRQHDALADRLPRPPAARCCPRATGFPARSKPLVRLAERERRRTACCAGIDYIVDECPMAAGNKSPRLQGGAERGRGAVTRHEARLLLRVPRRGRPNDFATRWPRNRRPCGPASAAAHRRRATCARSAGWSSGRPVPSRCSSAVGHGHDRRRRRLRGLR